MAGHDDLTGKRKPGRIRSHWARVVLLTSCVALVIVSAVLFQTDGKIGSSYHGLDLVEDPEEDTPFFIAPIVQPETVPAEQAGLEEDAMLVTVKMNGKQRAYLLSDLAQGGAHVVNDLLAGVPVSVTYCDQTDCVRVFHDPQGHTPIKLQTAGWIDRKMAIAVGSEQTIYSHDAKDIPLQELDFQRMSFGQWRQLYPEGTVYIGGIAWEEE